MAIRATIERRYLTTAEVAEILRTPPETLRFWRHRGRGPKTIKPGRRVLYPSAEFERWLAEQGQDVDGPGAA